MNFRVGKLFLIILVPALVYGALKGILYYNAKSTIDEVVRTASHQADIRYSDIETDLRGAVTVSGISIQPLGFEDTIGVGAVRFASDDPMFFIRGSKMLPGEVSVPNKLSFHVSGVLLPLSSDIVQATAAEKRTASGSCDEGLQVEPGFLTKMGFTELRLDMEGHYRLDETARTLDVGMNVDLHDIESMEFAATMHDVDVETLAGGAAPQFSLGRMSFKMRVSPEFGRQVLKTCAVATELTVDQWSTILADNALEKMRQEGLSLGNGLSNAIRQFYRDWGSFELRAAPSKPVGLLSLMFLPPDQLANTLGLQMRINDELIADTSFDWQQPQGQGLAALLGGEQPEAANGSQAKQRRAVVHRSYESVAVRQIGQYVGHQVQLTRRGQPMREGRLSAVGKGEVEVQQALHGGKYTVHIPLDEIESLKVLVRREPPPAG
jgi:hypothetical protein